METTIRISARQSFCCISAYTLLTMIHRLYRHDSMVSRSRWNGIMYDIDVPLVHVIQTPWRLSMREDACMRANSGGMRLK